MAVDVITDERIALGLSKPKPFRLGRSPVPREYTGPVWLLKVEAPIVWFGTATGIVFTGTVIAGGDFRESDFLKPVRARGQHRVQANGNHYGRTLELQMRNHGAPARTARDGPGQPLTMKAFYCMGHELTAGWDNERRVWVVEG